MEHSQYLIDECSDLCIGRIRGRTGLAVRVKKNDSYISQEALSDEHMAAAIGFDTAENEHRDEIPLRIPRLQIPRLQIHIQTPDSPTTNTQTSDPASIQLPQLSVFEDRSGIHATPRHVMSRFPCLGPEATSGTSSF